MCVLTSELTLWAVVVAVPEYIQNSSVHDAIHTCTANDATLLKVYTVAYVIFLMCLLHLHSIVHVLV